MFMVNKQSDKRLLFSWDDMCDSFEQLENHTEKDSTKTESPRDEVLKE